MSFILDALRRAEAERERGGVPGLHAQPAAGVLAPVRAQPVVAPMAWIGATVAVLLLVGGGAWWWLRPVAPTAALTPIAGTAPGLPAAPPLGVPPVVAVLPPPAPVPPPAAMPQPAPATMAGVQAPMAVVPPPSGARPVPALPSTGASVAAGPPPPPAAPAVPATKAAPVPPTRLPALAELPEPLRRLVPPLTLGGAVHADVPAQRIVIVNGQVLHEGDQPTPDTRVEQIRLRSVVFSVQGQRFEVGF